MADSKVVAAWCAGYGHDIETKAFFYDENTVYVSGKKLILHSFLFVIFNIFFDACLFKTFCQGFAFR